MSLIIDRDEQSSGPPVDQSKPLTGEPHGGGVYNRQVLLNILREQSEEELLIPILQ